MILEILGIRSSMKDNTIWSMEYGAMQKYLFRLRASGYGLRGRHENSIAIL